MPRGMTTTIIKGAQRSRTQNQYLARPDNSKKNQKQQRVRVRTQAVVKIKQEVTVEKQFSDVRRQTSPSEDPRRKLNCIQEMRCSTKFWRDQLMQIIFDQVNR